MDNWLIELFGFYDEYSRCENINFKNEIKEDILLLERAVSLLKETEILLSKERVDPD